MARNDIYKLEWASELDGAVGVNTLYYRQEQELTGPDDPEQQLIIDWFTRVGSPWLLMASQITDQLSINIARCQRVRAIPGLQQSRSLSLSGAGTFNGLYFPTQMAVQFSWAGSVNPQDKSTNRMNLMGFSTEEMAFNGYNDGIVNWANAWAPAVQLVPSSGAPSGTTWVLQFRTNTSGPMEDNVYEDAYIPFIRAFPKRVKTRTTRALAG